MGRILVLGTFEQERVGAEIIAAIRQAPEKAILTIVEDPNFEFGNTTITVYLICGRARFTVQVEPSRSLDVIPSGDEPRCFLDEIDPARTYQALAIVNADYPQGIIDRKLFEEAVISASLLRGILTDLL